MINKAFFLDRDGTLNYPVIRQGKPFPPQTLNEFRVYEDVLESLQDLKKLGFKLIVITNQPDVGRGDQALEVVEMMHKELMALLPLDSIKMCTDETSQDYKPNPGMILKAAEEFEIDLKKSYMVGDRWRDIGAGIHAGCYKTILIDRGYLEEQRFTPDFVCSGFAQVKDYILEQEGLKQYEK